MRVFDLSDPIFRMGQHGTPSLVFRVLMPPFFYHKKLKGFPGQKAVSEHKTMFKPWEESTMNTGLFSEMVASFWPGEGHLVGKAFRGEGGF